MPNRIVRDAILDSPRFDALSSDTVRLLFFELLLLADDYGLTPVHPRFLSRRTSSASRATDDAIVKMTEELADQDLIRLYQDGQQTYAYIPRFGNWPRAKKPKWPMPPDELGGNEIMDLQEKRAAKAKHMQCCDGATAPETETETETETEVKEESPPARAARASKIPACPHRELIAIFAATVVELPHPRPELWDGARGRQMRERWKWVLTAKRESGERYAETAEQAVEWFGRFFKAVAASDFLTGRNGRWTKCSLDWLMMESNFAKVVDGHYKNEVPA